MILRFYPTKDATIYEKYPNKNTGLDAVLDISKLVDGSASYNSRILLDFDYTTISASIVSLGYDPDNFNYNLKLRTVEANEIPIDYTLYAYAISGSWSMGIGRFSNVPQTVEGVSWKYKGSAYTTGSAWTTASYNELTTGSYMVNPGGGTWYTSSAASQSFSYTTTDVDLDVTPIINEVQSGAIDFSGFIVKKSDSDEQSNYLFNSLKFFSKDTHTVYVPVLEARYDDSSYGGSQTLIDTDGGEFNVIPINFKSSYSEGSVEKLRFTARYRYPTQVYVTSSLFVDRYRLPEGTQYAIYSATSDDVILNFSDYTNISADNTSNFVNLHLDSFQPEQYYRFLLRIPRTGAVTTYQVLDPQWIFKVTRNQ